MPEARRESEGREERGNAICLMSAIIGISSGLPHREGAPVRGCVTANMPRLRGSIGCVTRIAALIVAAAPQNWCSLLWSACAGSRLQTPPESVLDLDL